MTVLRLHRVVDQRDPAGAHVEIHAPECDCAACTPYRQPAPAEPPALTFQQVGALVWIGLAIGSAIAFAIDPHCAWLALTTVLTGGR